MTSTIQSSVLWGVIKKLSSGRTFRLSLATVTVLIMYFTRCDAEAACSRKDMLIQMAYSRIDDSIVTPDLSQWSRDTEEARKATGLAEAEDCLGMPRSLSDELLLMKLWLLDHYGVLILPLTSQQSVSVDEARTLSSEILGARFNEVVGCRNYMRIDAFATIYSEASLIAETVKQNPNLKISLQHMYSILSEGLEQVAGSNLPNMKLDKKSWELKLSEIKKEANRKYKIDFDKLPDEPDEPCR